MEYVIFRCTECDAIVAYPNRTADGRRCSQCKGFIVPIDKGTKQELIGRHGDGIVFNGMQTKKTSKKRLTSHNRYLPLISSTASSIALRLYTFR